jgi:4a-hydroxytetrahydrobiopterin dehydratase
MRLSDEEIHRRLAALPGWRLQGNEIVREFSFKDFAGSMGFVNSVAALADAADHHPDILIRYSKVEIRLSSHDAQGLTERDFALAGQIES